MTRKHSITIRGHRTSISLENEFWDCLRTIADLKNLTIAALITEIDETRKQEDNLSSAARLYVLSQLRSQIN